MTLGLGLWLGLGLGGGAAAAYILNLLTTSGNTTYTGPDGAVTDFAETIQFPGDDVSRHSGMRLVTTVDDGAVLGPDFIGDATLSDGTSSGTVDWDGDILVMKGYADAGESIIRPKVDLTGVVEGKRYLLTLDIAYVSGSECGLSVYNGSSYETEHNTDIPTETSQSFEFVAGAATPWFAMSGQGYSFEARVKASVVEVLPSLINEDTSGNPCHPVSGNRPRLIADRQDSTEYAPDDEVNFAGAYWKNVSTELWNDPADILTDVTYEGDGIYSSDGSSGLAYTLFTELGSKTGEITFEIVERSSGSIRPVSGAYGTDVSDLGVHTQQLAIQANGAFGISSNAFVGKFKILSVKLVGETGSSIDVVRGGDDVLGPDLVTNGTFATDTDWAKQPEWTISGGKANCTGSGNIASDDNISQSIGAVEGRTYRISFDFTRTSGSLYVRVAYGGYATAISASGRYSVDRVAGSIGDAVQFIGSFLTGSIDNVIVREVNPAKGGNIIENGDFSDGLTGWDLSSVASGNSMDVAGGRLNIIVTDGTNTYARQLFLDNPRPCRIRMDVELISGSAGFEYTELEQYVISEVGTHSIDMIFDGVDRLVLKRVSNCNVFFDNIIVEEIILDGDCAWQYQGRYQDRVGYLSEPGSTNLLTYSADTSSASWNPLVGLTEFEVSSIIDGETAWMFTNDGTGSSRNRAQSNIVASMVLDDVYTLSVIFEQVDSTISEFGLYNRTDGTFVGRVRYTWATDQMSVASGAAVVSHEVLSEYGPNGGRVVRAIATVTVAADDVGDSCDYYIYPTGSTVNTESVIIHHAQMEGLGFATSPIITAAATVTRGDTSLSVPSDGVVFNDIMAIQAMFVLTADAPDSKRLLAWYLTSSNYLIIYTQLGSRVQFSMSVGGVSANVWISNALDKGVPIQVQAYKSATGIGIRIRTATDGVWGAWSAWDEDVYSEEFTHSADVYIGGNTAGYILPADIHYLQTKRTDDPKAWLEANPND